MRRTLLASVVAIAVLARGAPAGAEDLVLDDPLDGSSTGSVAGGEFVAGGGWKVTGLEDRIYWHVPSIAHGAVEFSVRGINPNECRATMNSKSELFHLYDPTYGNADSDYSGYRNNPFKHFMRKTNCTDYIPTRIDSMEMVWTWGGAATETDTPVLTWDPATTYRFREEWGPDGAGNVVLHTTRDGAEVITITVVGTGAPGELSVRVGASGRGAAEEEAAIDAIYSSVKVWDLGSPAGPDAGSPAGPDAGGQGTHVVLDPVDDTFAAPLEPAAAHGDQDSLQVGGDGAGGVGRTVYFKFDLGGLSGAVASAKLHVKATNGGGGGTIAAVSDVAWTEEALTWNDRPAITGAPLGSLGTVAVGTEYTWDVAAGLTVGGLRSFAVTSTDGDGAAYASKENADSTLRPWLELTLGPAVPPDAGAVAGPDAASPPTGADAAGAGVDAGTPAPGEDAAATAVDAAGAAKPDGSTDGTTADGSCGCASGSGAGAAIAGAAALLAVRRRRRG